MGAITLEKLPAYLDRWGAAYRLEDGWLERGRASGGFDAIRGITVHHSAGNVNGSLAGAVRYGETAPAAPIGNGTISRAKDGPVLVLYAGKASNTAGAGGPVLTSRGPIAKDNANRMTVGIEAENNGIGEPWDDSMVDLYVRVCVAILDWANNETPGALLGPGDIFAHFEWAPGRKIDPWGPSKFTNYENRQWDMNAFRGAVFALMVAGPEGQPGSVGEPPVVDAPLHAGVPGGPVAYQETSEAAAAVIALTKFWGWYPMEFVLNAATDTIDDPAWQAIVNMQVALNMPVQDGNYSADTARRYSDFLDGMAALSCSWPPALKIGARGPDVITLQSRLGEHGWYRNRIDGSYGPLTTQAVQQLQRAERAAGHDPGPIDGIYGNQTRTAACAAFG